MCEIYCVEMCVCMMCATDCLNLQIFKLQLSVSASQTQAHSYVKYLTQHHKQSNTRDYMHLKGHSTNVTHKKKTFTSLNKLVISFGLLIE